MAEPPVEPEIPPEAAAQHPVQAAVVRFDAAVDRALDRLRGRPVADRIFYTASELGDFSLLWYTVGVAQGVRRGGDVRGVVRLTAAMSIESFVINGMVKSLFRRSRPVSDVPRPHRLRTPRTSSFPSGHASAAAVFVVVAGEDDVVAPLYAVLAATVALSRPYVRIHHASDVVAGIAAGAALGTAFRGWWPSGAARPRGLGRR